MKIKKNLFRALSELLCLTLALCMCFGILPTNAGEVESEAAGTAKTVDIVRAVKDIPRGTRITNDYLELVTVANSNIPANVMTDIGAVTAMYAVDTVYAGEFVFSDNLSGKAVAKVNDELLIKPTGECISDYLVVTDYIQPNTGEDVSTFIQELIDENPKRTLYFPDGVYTLGYSLLTSAEGADSVSFYLSDGAVLKASDGFKQRDEHNALICLGGSKSHNDIKAVGSYYSVIGGILDGNGKANGISVESGRESLVRNMVIKNAPIGILIYDGVNNGSSDCDFEDITIVGSGKKGTKGIRVEACDNTFTNIRIYNTEYGLDCYRGGNLIKSVIVKNDVTELMASSIGIIATADNWVSECYVENYATAYKFGNNSLVWNNTAAWTSDACVTQIAYQMDSKGVSSTLSGCRAFFKAVEGAEIAYVRGGSEMPTVEGAIFDVALENDGGYKKKLTGITEANQDRPESLVVPIS